MGGQQFAADAVLLDLTGLNRVVAFDAERGEVEVQAGIQWPELIGHLHAAQAGRAKAWAIRQKQTGVDRVTVGGSLAANIHGRGLAYPPFVSDILAFDILTADGELRRCSRRENAELFSLAVGGYGLFGVVTQVRLQLVPRTKVERLVKVIPIKGMLDHLDGRIREGCVYGDCQYATDLDGHEAEHPGVLSCYRPVPNDRSIPAGQKALTAEDWARLYVLARTDKKRAFAEYAAHYRDTHGHVYWSDTHQLSGVFQAYREGQKGLAARGTEMITEVYVTRDNFLPFMAEARREFRRHAVDPTYGTIRLIEADTDTFLPWARRAQVCIVCNLHVVHTAEGVRKAREDFRRIIDCAIRHGGHYFLTYHRWARRDQVEACYPKLVEFLRLKKKYDPLELFQSDWYRHYQAMFADKL
jgi:FAD/FMN-containing dehydrogenase